MVTRDLLIEYCLTSVNDSEKAIASVGVLHGLLNLRGFQFIKWMSNIPEDLNVISLNE